MSSEKFLYAKLSLRFVGFFFQGIHLLEYIRSRCQLPLSLAIDLCLINSGEPFRLASFESKLLPFERGDFPSHLQCVLAQIDGISIIRKDYYSKDNFLLFHYLDQGTYIPLLNNPQLMNTDFLAKLKKATSTKCATKVFSKTTKPPAVISPPKQQAVHRCRSFKVIAIAATFITINHH